MGTIRDFCKNKGINLKTPRGWAQLCRRTGQFVKKNKGHVFRSALLKIAGGDPGEAPLTYRNIRAACVPSMHELGELKSAAVNLPKVTFSVVAAVTEGGEALTALLCDLQDQILPPEEIVLCPAPGAAAPAFPDGFARADSLASAYARLSGDYTVTVREGDRLERETLFEFALEIARAGDMPAAVYCDHDRIVKGEYADPYFKPGWSPDLFAACDYVCGAFAARTQRIEPETAETYPLFLYAMLLRLSEKGEIRSVQAPLFHLAPESDGERKGEDDVRARALARRGEGAVPGKNSFGNPCARYPVKGEPLVSVIIPTCYSKKYIEKCVASVRRRTDYKNYEILVIDNSRRPPAYGQKRLKNLDCRILYVPEPFNWARLNNLAAKEAKGEYLLFLNDDTEVISRGWMGELLSEAQREDVGEAGALLLYPDGKVQHAGAFLAANGGGAKHWYQFGSADSRVYHDFLHYRRECTFVTGACVMVSREKFEKVGGFDEKFAVVSNDADFGIRLRRAGYRNIYLPDVKLLHKEKASRRSDGESEGEKFAWKELGAAFSLGDEYFNVNLDSYENTPSPDVYPPRAMLTGSPTAADNLIGKILLVKLDHIGDNVIALPAVRKIRALFPKARIDMLCAPWSKSLWEAQPEIGKVYTYEYFTQRSQDGVSADERALRELLPVLKGENYDLSVHLRRHEETLPIAAAAAKYCLAYSTQADRGPVALPVPACEDSRFRDPKWSMRDQLLALAKRLEGENGLDRPIAVPPETEEKMRRFAADVPQFSASLVIGIHAGAGSDFRQWGAVKFARLCRIILEKTDAGIVLFGGKGEKEINEKILEGVGGSSRIVSVAGEQSLLEFCALVKGVDYFIGNNSGPKHIACMQGVPTLSIDGMSDENEWSAPGRAHLSVRKVMNCSPCPYFLKEQCPKGGLCLARLSAGDVWRGLERLMLLYPKKQ